MLSFKNNKRARKKREGQGRGCGGMFEEGCSCYTLWPHVEHVRHQKRRPQVELTLKVGWGTERGWKHSREGMIALVGRVGRLGLHWRR